MAQTKAQLIAPVGSGLTLDGNLTATDLFVSTDYPTVRPALDFPFALTRELDSRITFGRSTTGTFVDRNGLIRTAAINQPRFDHNPATGESLGLLIEEQRVNLTAASVNFSGGGWFNSNATVTAAQTISPDGTNTGSKFIASSGTVTNYISESISVTSGTVRTRSIFAKAAENSWIQLVCQSGGFGTAWANFNLSTGVVGNTSGNVTTSIQNYGNGWYRCSLTATATATSGFGGIYISDPGNTNVNFNVGVTPVLSTGGGFYIWGAQLEDGSFPTSYIPTSGSSVTRTADIASITGTNLTSWYNQREGTWIVDTYKDRGITAGYAALFYMRPTNTGIGTRNEIYKGSGNSRFSFQYGINDYTVVANINSVDGISAGNNKIFAYYKENDFGLGFNGSIKNTDTSGGVQQQTDPSIYLVLGSTLDSEFWNGHFRRFTYYPVKLNSTQLTNLTS